MFGLLNNKTKLSKTERYLSSDELDKIGRYIEDNYILTEETAEDNCIFSEPDLDITCDAYPFQLNGINEKKRKQSGARKMEISDFGYAPAASKPDFSLKEAVNTLDESFSDMLLRKIDESGMSDAECYKKAHIDRKLFSKIRSDKMYHPSKATVLSFAVALELSLEESKDMLMKAGFALSHSNKFDIIVEYFITNKRYNIMEINEALYLYDQSLLGTQS